MSELTRKPEMQYYTMNISGKVLGALLVMSLLVGVFIAIFPQIAIAGAAMLVVSILTISIKYRIFWGYLILLLIGYLFFGRGFAYIGVFPLYVSEIGLVLACFAFLLLKKVDNRKLSIPLIILLGFIGWQILATLPYLKIGEWDTLRDSVIWLYTIFAFTIYFTVPQNAVDKVSTLYAKIIPIALVFFVLGFILSSLGVNFKFPLAEREVYPLKGGDVCVHLAGIAGFLLLSPKHIRERWTKPYVWTLWSLWILNFMVYGTINRGGMVSVFIVVIAIFVLYPKARWGNPLIVILVGSLLVSLFTVNINPLKQPRERGRTVSISQIVNNVRSIFGDEKKGLTGTQEWRLSWWEEIIDYTVYGDYFWLGKGYGINLATDDGFQGTKEIPLRSPHSIHFTILARSGVPGLIFWILFLVSFAWKYLNDLQIKSKNISSFNVETYLWIFLYWIAFVVNGSFDVFIEGPMGGIWFWSLTGIVLAYSSRQNEPTVSYQNKLQVAD